MKVELDVQTQFYDEEDMNGFNLIAEIPGTDLADEVVMIGAHFDSTHGATGATDNASGSAAMMEALRILQAVGARPRRTIRIALWGGEEQGLIGSREYVKRHFGDRETMELLPAHAKLSAYFNIDNGTGRARGVWMQSNMAVRNVFEQWIAPLNDLGVTTLGPRSVGGNRPHLVRCGRPARLPVHAGAPGVQLPHPPLQHGRLRPDPARGRRADSDGCSDFRLQRSDS